MSRIALGLFWAFILIWTIFSYVFPKRIYIKKLKRRMSNWTSNKAVTFIIGIGRDKTFFINLTASERSALKARLAAPNEVVSDEDLDLFLSLYQRSLAWFLISELSLIPTLGLAELLLKAAS